MSAASGRVLEVDGLQRIYEIPRGPFATPLTLKAVDGVSLTLDSGKTLAVVGESGCGKSTLARMIAMIEPPSAGSLDIEGVDVTRAGRAELKKLRSHVQIVFQNPYGSLNPRQRIGSLLEEPLRINRRGMSAAERRQAALDMLARVGLRPEHYDRYPHMFSGGQRQRIAIARALMLNPAILVLDEPVSALDLSVQAQVLNILVDLQAEFGLAYLFISHGLSVVRHMADEVMVMYLGDAGRRSEPAARTGPARRRAAVADQSAARLRFPSALSARLRSLPDRAAGTGDEGRRQGRLLGRRCRRPGARDCGRASAAILRCRVPRDRGRRRQAGG
jgi:dipeptide transport system ATP-binding protein